MEVARCTGIAARWCPIHGDCTCKRRTWLNEWDCPLHGTASDHPDAVVHLDALDVLRAAQDGEQDGGAE